ncbi:MAG: hypothetical protein H6581_03875 [Bacteroidia bacterium]|nr:hypothetical protein [Bacteroidia bacterium]
MTNQNDIFIGGWSPFTTLDEQASGIFRNAVRQTGILGDFYRPIAFATQLVSGINYCFFCNIERPFPNNPMAAAFVSIFKPLGGESPKITHIQPFLPAVNLTTEGEEF